MKNSIIIILIVVVLFYSLKKLNVMNFILPNLDEVKKGLKKVKEVYGVEIAKNVEKIVRLETRHFKSGGFMKTANAGIEAVTEKFPYGWTSLRKLWTENPEYAPLGIKKFNENKQPEIKGSGVEKMFLVFPNFTANAMSIAEIMKKRGNNAGRFFSYDEEKIVQYNEKIKNINPKIVDNYA